METEDADSPLEPRLPTLDDLLFLCRSLKIDLMKRSCGIEYAEAGRDIEPIRVRDVVIPFANAQLLWRTKQTHREKDALDRAFLEELLKRKSTGH